jgi:hypothetical protein
VPEAEDHLEEHGTAEGAPAERHDWEIIDDDRAEVASRRSFDSARYSAAPSTAGTDVEDLDDGTDGFMDASAVANGLHNSHRPLDVAIKEKTKRLFGLVKLGSNAFSPSSKRKSLQNQNKEARDREIREVKALPPGPGLDSRASLEFDSQSRRTSISSIASLRGMTRSEPQPPQPTQSVGPGSSPSKSEASMGRRPSVSASSAASGRTGRRASIASQLGASPQPGGRKLSILKRTVSGRSTRAEVDEDAVIGVLEGGVDHREGVYDSSKKQRVPSWVS